MDIKSNMQLVAEAAAMDIKINTANSNKKDTVLEAYTAIPTIKEPAVTEAADVIINQTSDGYYVEMVNLAPFMFDSGIKSIGTALDIVAEANNLNEKEVGLVVESQVNVNNNIANAEARAKKTGNYKVLENAVNKVNKNNLIIKRLLDEGYKVVKKSDDSKVCPKCGKVAGKCKCECGDNCGPDGGKSVIAESDDKKSVKKEAAEDPAIAEIMKEAFESVGN